MASELRVNTFKDASGNNSIATSFVANGSAKAWVNFDGGAVNGSTDLTGVNDSFNVSSLVDNGDGEHTVNIDSDMGNTNYNITVTDGQASYGRLLAIVESDAIAAGSCKVLSGNASTGGALDAVYFSVLIHGDLA
jgi:hypothetical protein